MPARNPSGSSSSYRNSGLRMLMRRMGIEATGGSPFGGMRRGPCQGDLDTETSVTRSRQAALEHIPQQGERPVRFIHVSRTRAAVVSVIALLLAIGVYAFAAS